MNLTPSDPIQRDTPAPGVVRLTLNRPDSFNALSAEMMTALQAALEAVAQDSACRVVVLAAAGRAFCAGHDLREMSAQPELAFYQQLFAQCSRMMLTIQSMPQPVVAQVQGIATAAGCQLVAMCDLAVAARDARFAVSGVNLGLFCATPSVALSRNLSRKQAFEMLVTGDFIDAQEARTRGLVNQVAEPDALDAAVATLVDSILAKPRTALAMGKALFYRQLEKGIEAAYDDAVQTMACNMVDACAQDGVRGFVEKKPAKS